jgi:3-phosphoshikimate 1-carboxyvinyltransferase
LRSIRSYPVRRVRGEIIVPGDKSISHRSIMISALADGESVIKGFLRSEDCLNTVKAFRMLGVRIHDDTIALRVEGKGLDGLSEPNDVIDVGNAGTLIRIISGVLAGQPFYSVLTGDDSIRRRPMLRVVEPLREMGATVLGRRGGRYAPLTIMGGELRPITYRTKVASAQVKSAILMAGLFAEGETTVIEPSISRDHTERMLSYFGAEVDREGTRVTLKGRPVLNPREMLIPGDISSAAYFIVAALLAPDSELLIRDVGVNPTRTGIIEALTLMGGKIEILNRRIWGNEPVADIRVRSSRLKGISVGGDLIVRMIDEVPILAVAATQAEGETIIRDAAELRVKESDRIATISEELSRMDAQIKPLDDGMVISGPTRLRGTACHSHSDHRVAMSIAIAGLVADGRTTILNADPVRTSFPNFEELLALIVEI